MKHNREAVTLYKCVNYGTSAQVTSSAGIFVKPIFLWAKMAAQLVWPFLFFSKKLDIYNQIAELS